MSENDQSQQFAPGAQPPSTPPGGPTPPPPSPPSSFVPAANTSGTGGPGGSDIEAAARAYRWVIGWFAIANLIGLSWQLLVMRAFGDIGWPPMEYVSMVGSGVTLLSLAAHIVMLVYVYRLASLMDSSAPWAWVVGMLICCANLIVLLVFVTLANAWFRQRGVRVGLLGPSAEAAAEAARRQQAEQQQAPSPPAPPPPAPQ